MTALKAVRTSVRRICSAAERNRPDRISSSAARPVTGCSDFGSCWRQPHRVAGPDAFRAKLSGLKQALNPAYPGAGHIRAGACRPRSRPAFQTESVFVRHSFPHLPYAAGRYSVPARAQRSSAVSPRPSQPSRRGCSQIGHHTCPSRVVTFSGSCHRQLIAQAAYAPVRRSLNARSLPVRRPRSRDRPKEICPVETIAGLRKGKRERGECDPVRAGSPSPRSARRYLRTESTSARCP